MRHIRTGSASALLLAAHACASAQATAPQIQNVIITGAAADLRQQSTTTAIIVGRDEILRQGDATLSSVLKRLPGITVDATPGKAAAIRMRGMGTGYVSILLNGVPAPGDFSLESISPDLIERIEVKRVATAETSSQSVAGTIDVILRRAGAARIGDTTDIKAGSAVTGGHASPQVVVQRSGRLGGLAYTLTATARRNNNPIEAITLEEAAGLRRRVDWTDHQKEDVLELAPRLAWQGGTTDSFTAQGYLRKRHMNNTKGENETTFAGPPTDFPRALHRYETRPLNAFADLAWNRKMNEGARLAAKVSAFYTSRDADFEFRGMDLQNELLQTNRVASGPTERELIFTGSWRRPLWRNHALAAGWELGRKQRSEYRREVQTSAAGVQLRDSDEHYRARVLRSAFFVQDEWDISAAWSAYLGLRREDLHTTGEGNADAPVDVKAGAWSPIFQTLYKPQRPDGAPRDQFRLAASRTYKAPNIIQLMPRRYTVDNNNGPNNPDQQGNPRLRPELAMAIDVAWERYIGKHGMISVSAFHKRIHDITLDRLDNSNGPWTATPDNQGDATVRGIEIEAKGSRGALAGRINLARNWSRVDSVPGPDNRIEGQAAYSGNIGADYAPSASSFGMGGTWTYRGRASSRVSQLFYSDNGARRQLDLYAVWKRDAKSRLRLSVSDALHRDYREYDAYLGTVPSSRTTDYLVRATWRLVWEQSL